MERIRQLASVLAVVVGAACAHPTVTTRAPETVDDSVLTFSSLDGWNAAQRDSAIAVLVASRAKWAVYRPRSHEYWERAWCFCFSMWSGPRVVAIRNQRLVSVTDTLGRTADSVYVKAFRGRIAGIDALFAALAAGIRDTAFAEVPVEYDPAHGHPVAITYDRWLTAAADEFFLTVSHLRPMP